MGNEEVTALYRFRIIGVKRDKKNAFCLNSSKNSYPKCVENTWTQSTNIDFIDALNLTLEIVLILFEWFNSESPFKMGGRR